MTVGVPLCHRQHKSCVGTLIPPSCPTEKERGWVYLLGSEPLRNAPTSCVAVEELELGYHLLWVYGEL